MDQPETNEVPDPPVDPTEPGHVMRREKYERMLEEQQK